MTLPEVKSCGVLVFRREPELSFLLMRHPARLDLPKGHVDPGETELQCALREMWEETGIPRDEIDLDAGFRYVTQYRTREKRFRGAVALKTLVIFLGWLRKPVEIKPTEHPNFDWFPWAPPHRIQTQTIDPLLDAVSRHFDGSGGGT